MAESKKKRSTSAAKSSKARRAPKRATSVATKQSTVERKAADTPVITHRTSSKPSTPLYGGISGFIPSNIVDTAKSIARNRTTWIWVGSIVLTLLIVLISWWQWQRSYVAVVNGQYIHNSALEEQLVANSGSQTLDTLIQQQLILQDAHRNGIHISEESIQAELDTFKESTGGEEAFQSSLIEYGISEDLLRNQIKVRLSLEELLKDEIAVSEEEIRDYYDQNKEEVDVADEGFDAARERIEIQLKEQRLGQESAQYLQGIQETSTISRKIDHSTLTFGRFLQEDVLSIPSDVWNLFASLAPSE